MVHTKFILCLMCCVQGCTNVTDIVKDVTNLAPYILVVGEIAKAKQAFIVADKKVLFEIDFDDVPFCLMSVFFVFNMLLL